MEKRLMVISLLAALIMYIGVGLTEDGVTASKVIQGTKTAFEEVVIATYDLLIDNPLEEARD
jgi:hypothetical protein